jgi:hypothetical protein
MRKRARTTLKLTEPSPFKEKKRLFFLSKQNKTKEHQKNSVDAFFLFLFNSSALFTEAMIYVLRTKP